MQASQKVAVDAVRIAMDAEALKPEGPGDVIDEIERMAQRLFAQVQRAEAGA